MNKRIEQFNLRLDQLLGLQAREFNPPDNSHERTALETASLIHQLDFDAEMKPKGKWTFQLFHPRRTFMQTLRAKPALIILFVLLALTLLSGVVYAVSRSLGYIPGVGIVEQGGQLRALAEPVSVTREGITLTVQQAVLSPDKTVIQYTLENIPPEAYPNTEDVIGCIRTPELHLPDGQILSIIQGGGGYTLSFTFLPIPANVHEVVFILPCISNTLPGRAPENWEISLRFVPAPPDLTILPVIELPTPTPQASAETPPTRIDSAPVPFQIVQALQVGEDVVLLGQTLQTAQGWIQLHTIRLTDAAGQLVFTTPPTVEGLPAFDWGVQFKAGPPGPFTFTLEGSLTQTLPNTRAEVMFDAGPNPQPGQTWTLNQPIEIGGRAVTLVSVQTDSANGYSFQFHAQPDVAGLSISIDGHTAVGGGGGGAQGNFSASVMYETLPKGQLRLLLSDLTFTSPIQTWTLIWDSNLPTASNPPFDVRLVLDRVIPLEDGYTLVGHVESGDVRILKASPVEPGSLSAIDSSGRILPLSQAAFGEVIQILPAVDESAWVYHLKTREINGDVILTLNEVNLRLAQPVALTLDLRPYQFDPRLTPVGVSYKTGLIPLNLPGLGATLYRAAYISQGNLTGFDLFFQSDPRLTGIVFEMPGVQFGQAMSDSRYDTNSQSLVTRVAADTIMPQPLELLATEIRLQGEWIFIWTP